MADSPISSVTSLGSIFELGMWKNTEQDIRVTFVMTGTDAVTILPEVYLTVLDIDCIRTDGVCETVTTQDQDMYLAGENVEVAVSGSQITAYATTHLNGEGNPENTSLTEEQKRHSLTLGFKNKQSFLLHMSIGNVWNWRKFMFSGISTQLWGEQDAVAVGAQADLDVPPSSCPKAQACHPHSCGVPAAKANSVPSSTSAVLYSEVHRFTCKPGYSVDGTPSGSSFFEVQCGSSGHFLPLDQDCIDIDYCTDNPCGANGQCFDCSTTGCKNLDGAAFLQRSSIVGGREFESTDDYACWCHENYQTALGPAGQLTCQTDDCTGHSECGIGGTCEDLSVSEQGPAGEFTCSCDKGYELSPGGGSNGGDTCSMIICGSISVENSNQFPSVELFSGDTVLVKCDTGYSTDETRGGSNFRVTCMDSGIFDGEASCSKIVCSDPPTVNHAVTDGTWAFFGESLTWRCHEGYTYAQTGEVDFSLACAANGHFIGQAACTPVICSVPNLHNAYVSDSSGSGSISYGTTHLAYCNTGYVTSKGLKSFVFECGAAGSVVGVEECEIVTCAVPAMTNVKAISVETFEYASPLTVFCKDGFHHGQQQSFSLACQEDGSVIGAASCVESVYTVSGKVVDASDSLPVGGMTVSIAGFTAQTLGDGYFTISKVPVGAHTLQVEGDHYITDTRDVTISEDANHDFSLSKELASGEWRWTLEWNAQPQDLDSHVLWGRDVQCSGIRATRDREPCSHGGGSGCYVDWTKYGSTKRCSSTCSSGNCLRTSVLLENDDTDGHGPETLYLQNVGQCDGDIADCMLVYEIKNYQWQSSNMDDGNWVVRMFNDHGKVFEMHQPAEISHNTVWYVVFTMNLKTGKLCPNWVDFSKGEDC
uniref:EGF-like domain-containing protein n=1 Tax=Noctiluca scintillans TaxID=2966 RepID=A0A7S1FI45_NOCSC